MKDKVPAAKEVLDQYKDYGPGYGWHAQNTIVDWKGQRIIHYPKDADFPNDGGTNNINQGKQQVVLGFKPKDFGDLTLEEALKKKEFEAYIKNLTGLRDPTILIQIGNYFQFPTRIWVPDNSSKAKHTTSAWLGCLSNNLFNFDALNLLDNNYAARGVRRP